jgi:hypothetical protein
MPLWKPEICRPNQGPGTGPERSAPTASDERRPEYRVFLAVDQELGECPVLWVSQYQRSGRPARSRAASDVETLGAGSGTEGIKAFT